ncbi:unnamed protein product [Peniophora sp. CBMAI 1063]|nr:unnamed protein product [Peniophora sp. CBMAI 1063]
MDISELLFLTAEFSLDERDVTPRSGICVDDTLRQPRYIHSATAILQPDRALDEELPVLSDARERLERGFGDVDGVPKVGEGRSSIPRQDQEGGHSSSSVSSTLSAEKSIIFSSPVLQDSNGVRLTIRKAAIRNVADVETSWLTQEGGEALGVPPLLHSSLHLQVGDLFLQFQALSDQREVRIWMIMPGDGADGSLVWRRFTKHPITHPILKDRLLGFVVSNPTTPSWVQANTHRRFQKNQPVIVDG